jgi:hypothetical protein
MPQMAEVDECRKLQASICGACGVYLNATSGRMLGMLSRWHPSLPVEARVLKRPQTNDSSFVAFFRLWHLHRCGKRGEHRYALNHPALKLIDPEAQHGLDGL